MDNKQWTDAEMAAARMGHNDPINAKMQADEKQRMDEDLTRKFEAVFGERAGMSEGIPPAAGYVTRADLQDALREVLTQAWPEPQVERYEGSGANSILGMQSAGNTTRAEPREMTALESALIEMDDILSTMSDTAARLGDFNDRVSGPVPEAEDRADNSSGSSCTVGHLFIRISAMRQLAYRLSAEVYRTQKIG